MSLRLAKGLQKLAEPRGNLLRTFTRSKIEKPTILRLGTTDLCLGLSLINLGNDFKFNTLVASPRFPRRDSVFVVVGGWNIRDDWKKGWNFVSSVILRFIYGEKDLPEIP
ncbi:hypothetical protein CH380_15140 [Leptospira adleri]|uniref:Uncharacterized protein n=1 Tax=Leptospira adleri TaxID=2023186 RepID=A0A2M9YLS1_9LEPT|nr:hypothetical protein CH380_15140 [Leptospira adleri]PJZ63667.1 hypothetical protein CH376_02155 [Leptospira adleri]